MAIVNGIAGASGGGTDTSDATGKQWDIKNGKTAYIASGKVTGNGYFPAMMEYGSGGYYSDTSVTTSGNKVTVVARIQKTSFTTASRVICQGRGSANTVYVQLRAMHSDAGNAVEQQKVQAMVLASDNTNWGARIFSETAVTDGEPHTIHFEYDGDAGTATLTIDGVAEDQTDAPQRVAPNARTLGDGAGSFFVGGNDVGGELLLGSIGFVGLDDSAGTAASDFMQTDGSPKELDTSTWTEWGAQPLLWHESGKMDENKGSAGAMTKNGTITLAAASNWS